MIRTATFLFLLLAGAQNITAQQTTSSAKVTPSDFKAQSNCLRCYIHRGRTYSIDSNRKLDGEGLRRVIKSNSQSDALLDDYQKGIKTSRIPAYTGSLGLLTFIMGPIVALKLENHIARHDVRLVSLYAGAGFVGLSYVASRFLIHHNEKNLGASVAAYNSQAPQQDQIKVDLTPTETGDGGQIKTIVPF